MSQILLEGLHPKFDQGKPGFSLELSSKFEGAKAWVNKKNLNADDGFRGLSAEELFEIGNSILEAKSVWQMYQILSESTSLGVSKYDSIIGVQHLKGLKEAKKAIKILEPSLVDTSLDIGTGTGASAEVLGEISKHVTGIDVVPSLLTWADKRLSKRRIKHELLEMDILNANFPPNTFDIIFANGIGGFISPEELDRFYKVVNYLLKPGGRFYQYSNTMRAGEVYERSPRAELAGEIAHIINMANFFRDNVGNQSLEVDPRDYGFEYGYYKIKDKWQTKLHVCTKIS